MIEATGASRLSPGIRLPCWLPAVAAGILAGAALFDLLPAAHRSLGMQSFAWASAGAIAMFVAASRLPHAGPQWLGWAAGAGVALHALAEGILAAAGFEAGAGAGVLTSLGLVAHLVPESLALFALLAAAGVGVRKAVLLCSMSWLLLISGFGAAQLAIPRLDTGSLAKAMALGAGAFLCVACLSAIRRSGPLLRNVGLASLAAVWVAAQHLF